jgi:hypothetical protein
MVKIKSVVQQKTVAKRNRTRIVVSMHLLTERMHALLIGQKRSRKGTVARKLVQL